MHPIRFAIQHATSEAEVLERLALFVDYLHSAQIDIVLPEGFAGLAARSVDDVRAWAEKMAAFTDDNERNGVAGTLWSHELRDAFLCAVDRLDHFARAAAGKGEPSSSYRFSGT